ncbi:MAG: HAD-IIIA family hydrolase [Bacteroidota bacterium]
MRWGIAVATHGAPAFQSGFQGWRLALISNQSGIGRGLITPRQAEAVHRRTLALLTDRGITIAATRYCPHAPWEGCACRKPSPAMIQDAAAAMGADPARSVMIGDKPSDAEAGRRAGATGIVLGVEAARPPGTLRATTWAEVPERVGLGEVVEGLPLEGEDAAIEVEEERTVFEEACS